MRAVPLHKLSVGSSHGAVTELDALDDTHNVEPAGRLGDFVLRNAKRIQLPCAEGVGVRAS